MQCQPESAATPVMSPLSATRPGNATPAPNGRAPGRPGRASSPPRPFRRCPRSRLPAILALVLGLASGQLFVGAPPALAQEDAMAMESIGVNINTATAAELAAALSGVGASRAEAIVRYREQFGPFESIEELTEVSGIGSATLERNRERLLLQ